MTKRKSSGLACALREEALDFFESEANVMTQFERWENAEASLFSDPRFWNAEELGEFARSQQFTRGVGEALRCDALAQHQREQRAFKSLERRNAQRNLAQEFRDGLENQTSGARWIGEQFFDSCGRQCRPRRNLVRRLMRRKPPQGRKHPTTTHSSEESLSNCSAALDSARETRSSCSPRPAGGCDADRFGDQKAKRHMCMCNLCTHPRKCPARFGIWFARL
jgi:hypothetical protein